MPTRVETSRPFNREFKRLARKFPHVRVELAELARRLEEDERPGDKIPNVGFDVYKVRLSNPSAHKGKRGGFRIIYYVRLVDLVILLAIYAKTEQTDIAPEQIRRAIQAALDAEDSNTSE